MIKQWHKIVICVMAVVLGAAIPQRASAQFYAVYGNALLLPTATINAGVNIGLSSKISLDLSLICNPLKTDQFSLQSVGFQPGVRFWLSEIQYSHFLGVHLFSGIYNIGDAVANIQGFTVGVGVSWGYNWFVSKRFNVGFEIGGGIGFMKDAKQNHYTPDSEDHYIYNSSSWAILPTKLAVNLIYLF